MAYQERFIPYTAGRPDYDDRTANRAMRSVLEKTEPKQIVPKSRRKKTKPLEPPKYEVTQVIEVEDPVEALIALRKLRGSGAITREDFLEKKEPLLEKLKGGI